MVDTAVTTTSADPTQTSTVRPVAFHAIFDCSNSDSAKIQNETNIKNWLADVASKISVTATEAPVVKSGSSEGLVGFVAMLLAGSNSIDANFVNSNKEIYVDIFANNEFNPELVEASIKEFFGSNTVVKKILIPRNASIGM